MTDDLSNRDGHNRARIDVSQDHELRHWSAKFNVTHETLKKAVAKVGVMADDVERELTQKTTN